MKKALILVLLFTGISFAQNPPMKDGFYIGYHNNLYYENYWQWDNYRNLNVNMMQIYGEGWDEEPLRPPNYVKFIGGFNDLIESYAPQVVQMINGWGNQIQPRTIYTEREKIKRGAYGQQSDYQAEMLNPQNFRPGYGYEIHQVGEVYPPDQYGASGIVCYVIPHAQQNPPPNRYIVKQLYENWEQSERITQFGLTQTESWPADYYYSDVKNSLWKWLVSPRMRINPSDANTEKRVVRIDIYNFSDVLIDSITIFANNFKQGGIYNGEYRDIFYDGNLFKEISVNATDLNAGNTEMDALGMSVNLADCKVDYRVYWWGDVDVWLDRVRLEDEWAFYLFHPDLDLLLPEPYLFQDKIHEEVQSSYIGSNTNFGYFYYDEFMYNRIPCISKVNSLIKSWNSNTGLVVENNISLISNYSGLKNGPAYGEVYNYLYSSGAVTDVLFMYQYPFGQFKTYEDPNGNTQNDRYTYFPLPPGIPLPDVQQYPATGDMGQSGGYHRAGGGYGDKQIYADSLNLLIQNDFESGFGWQLSVIDQLRRAANLCKLHPDVMFAYGVQQHSYEDPLTWNPVIYGSLREPTNEEIRLQYYLALAYSAKQFFNFAYYSYQLAGHPGYYSWGMVNAEPPNQTRRTSNYYGQNKWDSAATNNVKARVLGNYLFNFIWQSGYSVHVDGANHNYILDIRSSYQVGEGGPVYQDATKYWEMSFFTHSNDNAKYFMMVNRRCTPGQDRRMLGIKFNPALLGIYTNWKITDVMSREVKTFDKYNQGTEGFVDLGGNMKWFQPGEGKLFKLVPVLPTGGTLVTDEVVPSGTEFTCEDTVFSGGYNITIEDGAKIHFTDTSTIIMSDSGTFTMGDPNHQGPPTTTADAAPGNHWYGLNFSNCDVKIYSTTFAGLVNDSAYAVNIIDCPLVDLRSNVFNTESDNLKGALSITYYDCPSSPNVYIGNNTFNSNNSVLPPVSLMSYAGVTVPAIIEGNTFTSTTSNSTAITLSGIIGGAVKSNSFTGYGKSLTALSSSLDVSENTFTSTVASSLGIDALSGSEIKMNNARELILGGRNDISNTGNGSNNIYVNNSYFLLDNGENIFNIAGGVSSYHLYGFFPDTFSGSYEATRNCFKVDNSPVQPPVNHVTLGMFGNVITFNFEPYLTGCTMGGGGEGLVINLGDGLYDTVGTRPGGGSFGNLTGFGNLSGLMLVSPKTLYDSISIQMRFRNYNYVKAKCMELINTYPDSIYSLNAIPKLYHAASVTDTSVSGLTALKTFYENLILNHPNNTALVKRSNYFVQKCKVLLHQYTSALAGFEQIMLQNPYSYEGLVAHWDHMATQLLIQGQGGASPDLSKGEEILDELFGGDDPAKSKQAVGTEHSSVRTEQGSVRIKSPFTKEQKIFINKSINDALDVSRTADERRYIDISERSEQGDADATRELAVMKSLKEIIKPASPKNVFEHIKIVRDDMQRIFSSPDSKESKDENPLPTEFALSQNYPNPFNPVTKINYDIPAVGAIHQSPVRLIVYDILGREVIKLVDEMKKPGRYTVEFNGTNLASGVYFYRIEAGDFVLAKKMVLVK